MRLCITLVLILACYFASNAQIKAVTAGGDSLHLAYSHKLDSIRTQFEQRLDTIQDQLSKRLAFWDSIVSSARKPFSGAPALVAKSQTATDSIQKFINTTQDKIRQKTDSLRSKVKEQISRLNLPPEMSGEVEKQWAGINAYASEKLGHVGVANLNIESLPKIESLDLPTTSTSGLVNNIAKKVNPSLQIDEYSGYAKQAQSLASMDVEKVSNMAESKLSEVSGLNEIQSGSMKEIEELKGNIADADGAKAYVQDQFKQQAFDHFAGKEKVLEEAMDKLSKHKKKFANLKSTNDLPRFAPNEMKGKPIIERILPGVSLQIGKGEDHMVVDFNPTLGYRFTGRLTAGTGWIHRVSYESSRNSVSLQPKLYGPRSFIEYNLFKGFFPRVEAEVLYTTSDPAAVPVSDHTKYWNSYVLVGVKKEFPFVLHTKGTILAMARISNISEAKKAYQSPLNFRLGFEFPLKKRK